MFLLLENRHKGCYDGRITAAPGCINNYRLIWESSGFFAQ